MQHSIIWRFGNHLNYNYLLCLRGLKSSIQLILKTMKYSIPLSGGLEIILIIITFCVSEVLGWNVIKVINFDSFKRKLTTVKCSKFLFSSDISDLQWYSLNLCLVRNFVDIFTFLYLEISGIWAQNLRQSIVMKTSLRTGVHEWGLWI